MVVYTNSMQHALHQFKSTAVLIFVVWQLKLKLTTLPLQGVEIPNPKIPFELKVVASG